MFQKCLNHCVTGEYLGLAWTYCLSAGEDVSCIEENCGGLPAVGET